MTNKEYLQSLINARYEEYRGLQTATNEAVADYEAYAAELGNKERLMRVAQTASKEARIAWDMASEALVTCTNPDDEYVEPVPEIEEEIEENSNPDLTNEEE